MPMETAISNDSLTSRITSFLSSIGIPCREASLEYNTFLPGVDIREGVILYDLHKLRHPGDLLHEAGHLSVLLPEDRAKAGSPDNLSGDLQSGGAELGAIAWSWAALQHLQLAPEIVFHENGYAGGSDHIIGNFSQGNYFGVSLLQWLGMTTEPKKNQGDVPFLYPAMQHWLRPGPTG